MHPEISHLVDERINKESDWTVFTYKIFCTTGSTKYSLLKVATMTK